MDDLKQKIYNGFAWEISTKLVVQIISWTSTIWVARLLVPDDYGIITISGIFTGIFLMLSGMGLGASLVHKKKLGIYDLNNAFWSGLVIAGICYYSLYILAPYISEYYNIPNLEVVLKVAGLVIPISMLNMVPNALLLRKLDFKSTALISMAANLILTLSTLLFAFNGFGLWSLIYSVLLSELVRLILYLFIVRYFPGKIGKLSTLVSLYRYGLHIMVSQLLFFINSLWAPLYSGQFLGKTITGHFQMANTLAVMPMAKIGEIFKEIAFPVISRIQNDTKRTKNIFLKMHRYLLMFTLPIFFGMAMVAEELIPLLLGDKWIAIITPVQILCLLCVLRISAQIAPRFLDGLGHAKVNVKHQIILAITMASSMLLGVQWGLNWMLVGWGISFAIGYIYLFKKLFGYLNISNHEFLKSISAPVLSNLIMIICVLGIRFALNNLHLSDGLILSISIATGVASYILSYRIIHKQDFFDLLTLIKNK